MTTHWKHWRLEREADGVAWLWFDHTEGDMNVLSSSALDELSGVLDEIGQQAPQGLIIASAKSAGFIAGADVAEFRGMENEQAARALVQRGWSVFNKLAALPYPTLALIKGHCLGGGFELALACRYRIAVDLPTTRMALPEVMLGIIPGWGGMRRLPALIGPQAALEMMLRGKGINARRARQLGVADACVPERVAENAARIMVRSGRAPHRPGVLARLLNGPLKPVVAAQVRKQLASKVRRLHYPAPYAIVDMWARYDGDVLAVPADDPSSLESILRSPTAANLVRVFFLQERLKAEGKASTFQARHVHVVGAGVMGGDIAAVCALAGMRVTLQDRSMAQIAPALARADKLFVRKFRNDRLRQRAAWDRLVPDPEGFGIARADVIIEAVIEDLEVKRFLFADLEHKARPDALLATNTSSLRLEDIAIALTRPERLIGIHFFNPVPRMPLVEVVHTPHSEPQCLKDAAAFVRALDKLPLPVASAPGFLVNAVLAPYMLEALRCVAEGHSPEAVDKALEDFGMPMGPIELADTIGLDVVLAAGKRLTASAGTDLATERLQGLVAAGQLGRKSGSGFYVWAKGKPQKQAVEEIPHGLASRVVAPLMDAAAASVANGVVADAELADAGVIFGTGFAPFTGGPLHYREQLGASA